LLVLTSLLYRRESVKSSNASQHQVEAEVNIVVDEYQDPQVQEQGEYLDPQVQEQGEYLDPQVQEQG
jgi:hypothetical protein